MVDVTRATESKYLNADIVKESATKKLVILNGGEYVEGDYGERFQLEVEIDGKKKIWSPNKDTLLNLMAVFGRNSELWIGKIVKVQVMKLRGKDAVIGMPLEAMKVSSENI